MMGKYRSLKNSLLIGNVFELDSWRESMSKVDSCQLMVRVVWRGTQEAEGGRLLIS